MKILFVSLFLPQKNAFHAGGRYVYELIRNLSEDHEISLATRLDEDETPALEPLRPFCREIYPYTYRGGEKRGVFEILRLGLNYLGFGRFARRIAEKGRFDLVQVEWVESAIMLKKGKTPMVLDAHDVITKPAERAMRQSSGLAGLVLYLKYLLIRTLELRAVRKFDMVFTLSRYDMDYLLSMDPDRNVRVVPIPAGMDITDRTYERRKDTILFLASYKYRKVNVDAALYFYRSVFPLIRKEISDAVFISAGYGPPMELRSLQESDPHIGVPGFVEDLDECYKTAEVFVAPVLVGGGIIVKILDAMASGTPVVTTTYGNEGIGAIPGRDLLVADTPGDFAAAVVGVLRDKSLAERLSANGKAFVRRHYSLETVMAKIKTAYEELAGTKR